MMKALFMVVIATLLSVSVVQADCGQAFSDCIDNCHIRYPSYSSALEKCENYCKHKYDCLIHDKQAENEKGKETTSTGSDCNRNK